ncbi:pPIWI_RE module domain-containing protein [Micromonospora carbonacea]|uniref:pPIWI_RE module domain-containing protein n=1 Tax=Micromonospora carbonacea TaxID=47853 RepID=UPI003D97A4E8
MYNSIRPTAYEPDPTLGGWTENFNVIAFSEQWRSGLSRLYRLRHPSREQRFSLPVRQLNALLRAAAPGVVATGRGSGNSPEVPWIYARSRVPKAVIAPLVSAWVLGRYADEDRAIEVLGSMYGEVPEWSTEPVQLDLIPLSLGGTADPERRLYSLVPDILAARLAVRPYRPAGLEQDVWFRVVDREQGAELVSWPPHRYRAKNRTWFYSMAIAITMQTIPFRTSYRIHVSTGIRRWTTNSTVDLSHGRGARVLLDVPLPWSDSAGERAARLIGNRIGYRREVGRVDWSRLGAVNLLPDLDIMRAFPDALDIIRDPLAWLEGKDSIAAGIIHRNGAGGHEVADGVFPGERALIDAWVEEGLRPMLRRAPDLRRTGETNKPVLLKKPSKNADASLRATAESVAAGARRQALISCLGGRPLNIDILWQSSEVRRQLLASIAKVLGLPIKVEGFPGDQEWQFGSLCIRVRASELGFLGCPLELPEKPGLTVGAMVGEAIRARRAAVAARFASTEQGAGLTFVEIDGRERFKKADTDPKFALRLGLADTGRLSKFLVACEETSATLQDKVRWTVLDGLRQLGAVTIPAQRVSPAVPENLQYLALWVVRRRAGGPTRTAGEQLVAVLLCPGDDTQSVQGWDDDLKTWIPYPQLLLKLASRVETVDAGAEERPGRASSPQEQREKVERRIRSMLFQVRDRPTLLLANAKNLRSSWRWLQNGSLVRDQLGFSTDCGQRLASYGSDLRLVLVRDGAGRGEVPQSYAPGRDGASAGLATGLWEEEDLPDDNRVFVSITDKPHTAGKKANGTMKLGPHPSWRSGPAQKAWNPQYLELSVVGCLSEKALAEAGRCDVEPDVPSTWAAVAHQLRFHNDYVPLSRPLPMHLAKLAEDYVLPTEPELSDE